MTSGGTAERLYTPEILGLAVELAQYPLRPAHRLRAEVRSQSCGSTLALGLDVDSLGLISMLGMQVSACAIGQASAAIFARHAMGMNRAAIAHALTDIEQWLVAKDAPAPWPDLTKLDRARSFPARHGAILLPWRAAHHALSNS